MSATVPFTFGIALLPHGLARDWGLIEALLNLTLASILAQTDQNFGVILAGHDRPRTIMDGDPRLRFMQADWSVSGTGPHNDDSGRKKHAINDLVLSERGGLFMLVDADDWVDRRLVEVARSRIGPDFVGGLIETGFVTDFQTLRTAPLPHASIFADPFHRVCGSSTVAFLRPDEPDAIRRDPFSVLRSHHRWVEVAAEHHARLATLSVSGNYLVNTSENHSDLHGPHVAWRQAFIASVNREGSDLDRSVAAEFGLDLDRVRSTSRRFFADAAPSGSP